MKKCWGRYYNFKKGVEVCKHRDVCPHVVGDIVQVNVRHGDIKDFRNCKLYLK